MKNYHEVVDDFVKRNHIRTLFDKKSESVVYYFLDVRIALNMNLDKFIDDINIKKFIVNGIEEEYITKGSLTLLLLNSKTKYAQEMMNIIEKFTNPNNRWG